MNTKALDAATDALRDAFDRGEGGFEEQAHAALEAASPLRMAEAWNQGLTAGIKCERGEVVANPYEAAK